MIQPTSLPDADKEFPIDTALLSVFDKDGIVPFARSLVDQGITLLSSGGTAEKLRSADLPVTGVEEVTGYPELLDGRVKTLHPKIHAGILARRNHTPDLEDLDEVDAPRIDLVVVNLYPFGDVVDDPSADHATVLEHIDIGGPTLVRAAAKNYPYVGVVTAPDQYDAIRAELSDRDRHLSLRTRRKLATRAFQLTAEYDTAVAEHLGETKNQTATESNGSIDLLPQNISLHLPLEKRLRYGENPHQKGALYGSIDGDFEQLHGRELSFNNLLDTTAAFDLIDEFGDASPACAILKHTNPCGVAISDRLVDAYRSAFETDRQSPYGGIVIVNRPLDRDTAEAIDEIFTEIIIAPEFEPGVVDFLQEKKRRRLIRRIDTRNAGDNLDIRTSIGGLLVQESDPVLPTLSDLRDRWEIATERQPTEEEWIDLDMAWRVVKHVKSNAIVYARDGATLGVGAGQMSRVDASELAIMKSKKSELDLTGSVIASDAFFPFADGLVAAAEAGARAAIQPGGSIRDDEVIEAANEHNVAMVMTGHRHFRH